MRRKARMSTFCTLLLFGSVALLSCGSSAAPGGGSPGAPEAPQLAGCSVFPTDNYWNARVDSLPLLANSNAFLDAIGRDRPVHPDFGSGLWDGAPIGIPFMTVPATQPRVEVDFLYASESDPGPYPIPPDAPVEGAPPGGVAADGDRHVLVLDTGTCVLYELFEAVRRGDGSWSAGSGAVFDLSSNALRPAGWTSADAAGLPILPGLVRYDEVAAGEIRHALRFTAPRTQAAYVWPARHKASSSTDPGRPPMGQRFRLRADLDTSGMSAEARVIAEAMKRYGIVLADNGSPWFLSGAPDERWNNAALRDLRTITGADFEAVDTSSLMLDADSAAARTRR